MNTQFVLSNFFHTSQSPIIKCQRSQNWTYIFKNFIYINLDLSAQAIFVLMYVVELLLFLLLFNDLKYGKSSLFCCNGYRHALFIIIFFYISSKYLKKAKENRENREKNVNDFFYYCLLHFYELNYLNLTKSLLSNQKTGMVPEVILIQKLALTLNLKSLFLCVFKWYISFLLKNISYKIKY